LTERNRFSNRLARVGIFLEGSSYNALVNNTANSNSIGIRLLADYQITPAPRAPPKEHFCYSMYNMLVSNTASSNDYGIYLEGKHPRVSQGKNTLTRALGSLFLDTMRKNK
jgi:parallel beta-helix repeat protein